MLFLNFFDLCGNKIICRDSQNVCLALSEGPQHSEQACPVVVSEEFSWSPNPIPDPTWLQG